MNSTVDVVKIEPTITDIPPLLSQPVIVAYFSQCNVCGERFVLHADHVQHMTVHLGTHPVNCSRCPARYAVVAELTEHIKHVHVAQDNHVQQTDQAQSESAKQIPSPVEASPPSPDAAERLGCEPCGVARFPSFAHFHDHHLYEHLATRGEPRVTLERDGSAAAAAAGLKLTLRRSSQEQSAQFEVIPSDGGSSAGSDSGMDASEPSAPPSEPVAAPPSPARQHSDEGLDAADDDSRWSAGDALGADGEDGALPGEEGEFDNDDIDGMGGAGDVDPLADPAADGFAEGEDPDDPDDPGADGAFSGDYMNLRLSDAEEEGEEPADSGLQSDAEPADADAAGGEPDAEGSAEAAEDAEEVTGDVLNDGEEQDDVLRLLDSLNRDGARGAEPPPPRLLPVGSPAAGVPQRMTASAPPAESEPAGSPAPPRSVASDPGASGENDTAPSLQDLVGEGVGETDAPPAGEGAQAEGEEKAGEQGGAPLIRMAAIAANIPDERSFRHEAATPAPPPMQPRPDGPRPQMAGPAGLPPLTPGTRPPGAPGAVTCFVCQLPLPDVRSLQEHLLTHQSSLQCSMCPFKATSITDLKAHSVTFHGKMEQGAVGRPPNSNMSAHMAMPGTPGMQPMGGVRPMAGGLQPAGVRYPHIRRGRPPLDAGRLAQMQQMNGLRGRGMLRPGQPLRPGISPQKRPAPGVLPDPKRRPGIPLESDRSDCQVIAVQRRQQGVPVIQNVEGSAYSGGDSAPAAAVRLSSSITLTPAPAPPASQAGADVASILANRGISITPASSAPAPAAAPQLPVSLPNLPAGISLTPAASNSSGDGFAVPRPPGSVQHTNVSRPARPPTVDLTSDAPSPPRSALACRYCERTLPSALALAQHEKAHVSGTQTLRCRVCGIVMQNLALLQQHMQQRHGSSAPPAPPPGRGAMSELVVPVFDLGQVSRDQLEALGVRGFLPVSQVNQRQGQLGLPIISLQGLGKTGPSPRPVAFFNLGPVRPLR